VRDTPEKLHISIFTTRVKRWNLGIAQCENIWHANGNRIDDTDGSTLYSFQTSKWLWDVLDDQSQQSSSPWVGQSANHSIFRTYL